MNSRPLPKSIETAQRIKTAARSIFLEQGLFAARTFDIAQRADTTSSLIFYHFRTKEKLYQLVMLEELGKFLQTLVPIVTDESTNFERKVELVIERYIALINYGPHIPLFVINELQKPHSAVKIFSKKMRNMLHRSCMAEQLAQAVKQGRYRSVTFADVVINILSLTVFPVVAGASVQIMSGMSAEEYNRMLLERKPHLTRWALQLLK